jgi:hypothetical protein
MDAMCRTDIVGTGGNKPLVYPLVAKITLLGNGFTLVKCNGVVRTFFDATPTSGAEIVIHDNYAVWPFADGFFRTGLDTRGILAMAANVDLKGKIQFAINQTWSFFLNVYQFDAV